MASYKGGGTAAVGVNTPRNCVATCREMDEQEVVPEVAFGSDPTSVP